MDNNTNLTITREDFDMIYLALGRVIDSTDNQEAVAQMRELKSKLEPHVSDAAIIAGKYLNMF